MRTTEGGNLGQVSDADDLTATVAHLLHHLGHFLSHLAADAGVNLIEDDGGQFDNAADHRL